MSDNVLLFCISTLSLRWPLVSISTSLMLVQYRVNAVGFKYNLNSSNSALKKEYHEQFISKNEKKKLEVFCSILFSVFFWGGGVGRGGWVFFSPNVYFSRCMYFRINCIFQLVFFLLLFSFSSLTDN